MNWNQALALDRYCINNTEDHEALSRRVGTTLGNGDIELSGEFFRIIHEMKFIPGGRILRNAGRPKGGLINCFGFNIPDHIEGIAQVVANCMILNAEGGGVGLCASNIRPKGDPIKGKGGFASGPISWLKIINTSSDVIETGGQRRAAMLALLAVDHPDIEKFITAKTIDRVLNNFNISVGITNNFLEAVREDDNWNLQFRGKIYKEVKARDLWNKIIDNMLRCAEPGLLNLSNLYKNNSWTVGHPIVVTNPCGEVPVEDGGACCLGSLVLPAFIHGEDFDWKEFDTTVHLAIKFLDNVLDANTWTLQLNRDQAHDLRRIGLGTMGLADCLFGLGIRYGSETCIDFLDTLYSRLRNAAYRASIDLAREKGSFPTFTKKFCEAKFIRTLPRSIQRGIKEHGIRNVTVLTSPPCGTTSLLVGVTSGIEPLFAKSYERRDRYNKGTVITHDLAKQGCKEDWFVDAQEITPYEHLEVQATVQKYLDGAVSKTINVPEKYTGEDLSALLLDYLDEIKGVTIYREGSREGQVLTACDLNTGECE